MGTSNGADASAGAHGQPEAEADSGGVEPTRAAEAAGSLRDPALAGNVEQRSEQLRPELRDDTVTGRSGDLDKCPACDASADIGAPQRAHRELNGAGPEARPKGKRFLILFAGRERPHDLRDGRRGLTPPKPQVPRAPPASTGSVRRVDRESPRTHAQVPRP